MEKRKRRVIILLAAVVLCLLGAAVGIGLSRTGRGDFVERQLALGERYLHDMRYEEAIVAFEEVIHVDPKQAQAYEGMALAYHQMGEDEKALKVLEDGIAQTASEKLGDLLREWTAMMEMEAGQETEIPPESDSGAASGGDGDAENGEMEEIRQEGGTVIEGEEIGREGNAINGSDFTIEIKSDREAVISLTDPQLISVYRTNMASSPDNALEHGWTVTFSDGTNTFDAAITCWAFEPGAEENVAIDQLQSDLWLYEGMDAVNIGSLSTSISGDTITWTVEIPEEYNFSFYNITECSSEIFHIAE